MVETVILSGCTAKPLAGYLKGLGVLRLLASPEASVTGQAADATARGWWAGERFHIDTALGREGLTRFLLEDWSPTPMIGAWNGRAGFLEGDDAENSSRAGANAMRALESANAPRFAAYAATIAALRNNPILAALNTARAEVKKLAGLKDDASKEASRQAQKWAETLKSELLPALRGAADERHLRLIDAAMVLADKDAFAPLLGSGLNDGSRDFGVNVAEALLALFDPVTGTASRRAADELSASLFGEPAALSETGGIGMFAPGQEGPNAGTGFSGANALNLWDGALAFEGALFWSGAATRRLGAGERSRAAFPFSFAPSRAGVGALSEQDPNEPMAEIWAPFWRKPATAAEVEALFGEGRLTLGVATARSGLDAARAVSRLGAARGVAAFERFAMVVSDAKMPRQATPLGRIVAPKSARRDLIADLDQGSWLSRLRGVVRAKIAPARARVALRRLEDALFAMTDPARAQPATGRALEALGEIALWTASSREARENLAPPPPLSPAWLTTADDGGPEFAVAAALASLGWPATTRRRPTDPDIDSDGAADPDAEDAPRPDDPGEAHGRAAEAKRAPPMAAHLAPLAEAGFLQGRRRWADGDPPTRVWGGGGLVDALTAILERRLVEAARRGLAEPPFEAAGCARLRDVDAFLRGAGFDDARCARLLTGLVWARPRWDRPEDPGTEPLDRARRRSVARPALKASLAYAALKAMVAPLKDAQDATRLDRPPPVPLGLLAALRRGEATEACSSRG